MLTPPPPAAGLKLRGDIDGWEFAADPECAVFLVWRADL
jgi:hypothetical protein